METYNYLAVFLEKQKVGTVALYQNRYVAFEYEKDWLQNGFSISPFSLPLKKQVFLPKIEPFDGLFGVFADSLPDGWGRLLVDRMLLQSHIDPSTVDSLNRLAIVGESGMGALTYQPVHQFEKETAQADLDYLASECKRVLGAKAPDDLDTLFRLGGSSGGARPKVMLSIDGEEWIVKFPSSSDPEEIGEMEYRYAQCAKQCGIEMAETKLFPSRDHAGYFGTKRFDRITGSDKTMHRVHMLSVSALLETSHRIPNLDYNQLMQLTLWLTNSFVEVEKLYRLMCFNVFAHNRDDHSKNFSFLYDRESSFWKLAPAYDLTYSNSIGGEHATSVNGNGRDPKISDLLAVADYIGLRKEKAKRIAREIQETVKESLGAEMQRYGNGAF